MNFEDFLERIIHDGMEAAKRDYEEPRQRAHLHGSLAGFESCRRKSVPELSALMVEAQQATLRSRREQEEADTYWFKRCYELEIEWVCNVVSAVLVNQGRDPIVPVTGRGLLKAAEIVGVRSAGDGA